MTFLKFYAFIMALTGLRILIFGSEGTSNLDIYLIIGRFIGYSLCMYLTYLLFSYSGSDVIEFFKGII